MINRLNLAADPARGSLAATGDGRGSNIGEAFQAVRGAGLSASSVSTSSSQPLVALKETSKMRLIDAVRMAH
jgi:hypothetical protein